MYADHIGSGSIVSHSRWPGRRVPGVGHRTNQRPSCQQALSGAGREVQQGNARHKRLRNSPICRAAQHAKDYDWGTRTGHKGDPSCFSLMSIDTEGPWIACLGQSGDSHCGELTELYFHVYFHGHPGEHLSLVGNHPAFGSWDLGKAFVLKWTPNHVWQTETAICMEPGTVLEYKYVLFRDGQDEPVWQGGKNMVVHIPEDSEGCRFIVEDSWDSSRHDHHMEKPDEHSLPQAIPLKCFECGQCLMPHLHWRTCPKLGGAQAGAGGLGHAVT